MTVKIDFMKEEYAKLGIVFLLGIIVGLSYVAFFPSPETAVSPLFSPGAEGEVISLISSAKESIDVEVYVFTHYSLADALIDARGRGVNVRVILEPRLEDNTANERLFGYLSANGIDVRWASLTFTLTHSKFMVIDGKKVLVGSINFSKNAMTTNREAAVIFTGSEVSSFVNVFEGDWRIAS
jgi:phosphatidylserine/phosphatidylglycerophosphate/cardiolipin synthase-like enzyme